MERVRHLVIGAGVSGLAFADAAKGDVLVVEADAEIGGYCKTITKDGFVWDYSGHFFHFKHADIEADLVARMQAFPSGAQRVLKVLKDSRIFWGRDRWIDFPFQKNIHQLPHAEFLECLSDLHFRTGWGRDRNDAPKSFKDMLYARFGRGIAERFLVPYNEKLYATDLSMLDVDAMGRFFPHADVDDIIKNFTAADNASYNSTFTYPEGGAIQYVHALAAGVPKDRIALGERVTKIDLRTKVATTSKREIAFEHVVSSAPFPSLLRTCGLPIPERTYSWNQVLVFNLGFDRKGPPSIHWAYFPQRELSFYRVGFYDNIFGNDRMSLYVEIGSPAGAPVDVEGSKARVLADLAKVGIVDGHRLIAEHHVVMDPAYVHVTRAAQADFADKKALLASRGVHTVGRYGGWTYCSIEDNIVESRALARSLSRIWGT
jgi:protoporphyrinogen oxidase